MAADRLLDEDGGQLREAGYDSGDAGVVADVESEADEEDGPPVAGFEAGEYRVQAVRVGHPEADGGDLVDQAQDHDREQQHPVSRDQQKFFALELAEEGHSHVLGNEDERAQPLSGIRPCPRSIRFLGKTLRRYGSHTSNGSPSELTRGTGSEHVAADSKPGIDVTCRDRDGPGRGIRSRMIKSTASTTDSPGESPGFICFSCIFYVLYNRFCPEERTKTDVDVADSSDRRVEGQATAINSREVGQGVNCRSNSQEPKNSHISF